MWSSQGVHCSVNIIVFNLTCCGNGFADSSKKIDRHLTPLFEITLSMFEGKQTKFATDLALHNFT